MENFFTQWPHSTAPILLEGPTGTGKSYWAIQMHRQYCSSCNLVTVHLASICDAIIESELFGHKRGAFTGAVKDHIGYCEQAHDGILFLDEIGELKLEVQQKLLYLLEERKYAPVGSGHEQNFTGKIIAATNRNLRQLVSLGKFREDLYYRLRVLTVEFAPLVKTPERILPLLDGFLNELWRREDAPPPRLSKAAEDYVLRYSWPGNIREIKNCAQYLVLSKKRIIEIPDLPSWLRAELEERKDVREDARPDIGEERVAEKVPLRGAGEIWFPLEEALAVREKQCVIFALAASRGDLRMAAQLLAIPVLALLAKIQKYGINGGQGIGIAKKSL